MDVKELSRENGLLALEVKVEQTDYRQKFDEELRNIRKRIQLPGFRAGQVPASLVKKQYGASILYETVSRKAVEQAVEYTEDYGLKTFGMPLLHDTDITPEGLGERDYHFTFHIGLMPELDLDFNKLPQLNKYKVEITDADVEEAIRIQLHRKGERTSVGVIGADSEFDIEGRFEQVDEAGNTVPNGISVKLEFITLYYKHIQSKLAGKQVGDRIPITFTEFFVKDATARRVLNVSGGTYAEIKNLPLHFEVMDIKALTPADLANDELRKEIMGKETANVAEFKTEFKTQLQAAYDQYADRRYNLEAQQGMLDAFPFELPIEHVERMLVGRFEDVNSVEELYQKHPSFYTDLKLFILHERLKEAFPDLKVTEDDVMAEAARNVKQWFGEMGNPFGGGAEGTAEVIEEEHIHDENCDHSHEEGHVHDENCNHDHHGHHHHGPDEMAQNDVQDAAIQSLVQRLMSDEKYMERTSSELQASRILGFLKEKYTVVETTTTKEAFDEW